MSAIVSGIVNSTIGLLCNKLRDYTAQRLNEGDINDSELRQIIVRDLDDIKTKLDGLSRKDLLASLSFFEEGVTRLYISLKTYGEACEKPSTSRAHTEDEEPECATAAMTVEQFPVKQVEGDAVNTAFDLHKLIGNLKIASEERYQLAKKSFEEAKRLATEAFNNTALSVEDRVMASKLRIASRIFGGLDDPEAAIHDCLLYLKGLQNLPAVQALFTVWREKGFTSRLRARFNQTERNNMVESIQAINGLLFNLTLQHTNIKMGAFNWPTINIGKEIYHPILHDPDIMKESVEGRYTKQVPWIWRPQTRIEYYSRDAITTTGKILSNNQHGLKIAKPNGECSMFCTISLENDEDILNEICCFAVDENDNVYIVIKISSCYENVPTQYKLLTFDENRNAIADRALDIIEKLKSPQMTVTKDGKLVIYCDRIISMYICDNTNVEKDYKFPVPLLKNVCPDDIFVRSCTVTDQNKVIYVFSKLDNYESFFMHIFTMDGELKHKVKVPATISFWYLCNVVFNHVNKTILVSLFDGRYTTSLFSFSKTGELLYKFQIPGCYYRLTSHPNGPIALVKAYEVMMLQM